MDKRNEHLIVAIRIRPILKTEISKSKIIAIEVCFK